MKQDALHKLILVLILGTNIILVDGFPVWAAGEQADPQIYEEEAVVVTATRTKQEESKAPGKTEVITKEEIKESGAATVAEVLTDTGLVLATYGGPSGKSSVQLDGAAAEETLVLINGVPANGGCDGYVDLSYFPVAGIERIEVAHGPLSALYGANALGGVVNIITDLTGEPANQASLTGGSNTFGQIDIAVKQVKYGIAVGGFSTAGHREHSATDTGYLMGQYDFWKTDQAELRLNLMYNAKDFESPGAKDKTSFENGRKENFDLDLYGKNVIDRVTFEYKIYGQNNDYDYNTGSSDQHYGTTTWGGDFAASYQIAAHQLLGGIQLQQDKFDDTYVGRLTRENGALFLQDSWQIAPLWQLVSGLRWDTGSAYSSPVCPRFGLNYTASDQFTVKVGYGKAFRAPGIEDLYWPETSDTYLGKIYYCKGNRNLKPETSERYEITGEWHKNAQTISLNCFTSKVKDGIRWEKADYDTFSVYTPININRMKVTGGVLSWRNQLTQHWFTGFKYTRADRQAWDDDTQSYSDDKNDCGKDRYTLNLGYQRGAWNSNLDCNWVTQRNDNQSDYAVWNINLKYQVNVKLNYVLTVSNLTGKDYEVVKDYPMPSREYYLKANYTF